MIFNRVQETDMDSGLVELEREYYRIINTPKFYRKWKKAAEIFRQYHIRKMRLKNDTDHVL